MWFLIYSQRGKSSSCVIMWAPAKKKKEHYIGMGELSSSKNIHSHDRIYRWKHKKIFQKRTGRKKFSNHAWHEIKINVSDSIRTEAKWVKFILWALLFVLRCKLAGWVRRLKSRSRDKYFLRQQMTSSVKLYDFSVGVWLRLSKSRRLPRFQPSRADRSSRFTILSTAEHAFVCKKIKCGRKKWFHLEDNVASSSLHKKRLEQDKE